MDNLIRSPKQLGVILRRHRRAQNITQTELGILAGIRQGTISKLEKGLETVKLSTVMNLLHALDLELYIGNRTKSSHVDIENQF